MDFAEGEETPSGGKVCNKNGNLEHLGIYALSTSTPTKSKGALSLFLCLSVVALLSDHPRSTRGTLTVAGVKEGTKRRFKCSKYLLSGIISLYKSLTDVCLENIL